MASIPGKYTAKKQFNRAVNVATDDDLAITVSLVSENGPASLIPRLEEHLAKLEHDIRRIHG